MILGYARKLAGEEADPHAVATALFKAGFDSLVRLAASDERRAVLLRRVGERAYEEETGQGGEG